MKTCRLVSLLLFSLSSSISVAFPQATDAQQAASVSQSPRWTEADKKSLLAKAQRGDRSSQFWLGAGSEQGWFGKADFREALRWLTKAAAQGDPDAQNALGQMYENGEGVSRDYVQAAKWYRKAGEHFPDHGGAGQGRNNRGLLYLCGHGVPNDYVQAYMWFKLARTEENLSGAKAQMNSNQIARAELMARKWKGSHPEP